MIRKKGLTMDNTYTLPPSTIDTPSAWYGHEMAKNTDIWLTYLSAAEVSELENAAEHFQSDNLDLGLISKENFSLPLLEPRLRDLREKLMHGIGFELIRGLPVTAYSQKIAATIFCGIGAHLGRPRSQNAAGHILGHVRDLGLNANDAGTRIYQTSERQTFHTDSTDVVGLMCLRPAKEGGQSLLASTATIYNEMQRRRPDLVPEMFKPVATDRRGEVPPGQKAYFEIPVLNWHRGLLTGIYQRQYVNSAQRFPDAPRLSGAQVEALDFFDSLANDPQLHLSMELQPGDMQFVYNHALLHDRTAFIDWPEPDKKRHLLRLWLSLPDDRPLPECFRQRYGSIDIGNRGGIIVEGTKLNVPLDAKN
ncbi:TauD/TfdA family dioxygenase [uncultured Sneathiella sp.]|uniref:TauD/TfdA family dioxygenase n=1 Tax=uncultured Sneathiella sp. TaxID=879315 RepID=UPI0030EB1CE5|tara:strand:+ start:10271 stop:11362 length:1092 start_codon:yes stop_codon:yes gene_type:complete